MTILIAVYLTALSVSTCFFLWAIYSFVRNRRTPKRQPTTEVGPDSEPLVVALYCQYLVAPEKALEEARRAVLAGARHRPALPKATMDDFFLLLDLLQSRSPASSR